MVWQQVYVYFLIFFFLWVEALLHSSLSPFSLWYTNSPSPPSSLSSKLIWMSVAGTEPCIAFILSDSPVAMNKHPFNIFSFVSWHWSLATFHLERKEFCFLISVSSCLAPAVPASPALGSYRAWLPEASSGQQLSPASPLSAFHGRLLLVKSLLFTALSYNPGGWFPSVAKVSLWQIPPLAEPHSNFSALRWARVRLSTWRSRFQPWGHSGIY